jgi:2-oxoglutarate dehydrogenase E2 component (dihydrolipoamide succinyltransferase)
VRSPFHGRLSKFYAVEGQEVNVDENLFEIVEQDASSSSTKAPKVVAQDVPVPVKTVEKKVTEIKSEPTPLKSVSVAKEAQAHRSETRVKMTRMRQRIAQRLKDSQNTAAMLTTFQEVDMTNLIDLRNRYKEDFEKIHGVKLGFMSAFVRVCLLLNSQRHVLNIDFRHPPQHCWRFLRSMP